MKEDDTSTQERPVRITLGLQPHHIEVIEKELQRWRDMPPLESFPDTKVNPLYIRHVWEKLGRTLGWCPFTLCLYYFEYLEEAKTPLNPKA